MSHSRNWQPKHILPYRSVLFTFAIAFFKKNRQNSDYAITERIKKCGTSEEITDIINKHKFQLNMVHLSAILDRIEQESMISIDGIVEFVVQRLSGEGEFFRKATGESVRTVCNIVCYLGNLKKKELNNIFTSLDYPRLLSNEKTLEKTMLITGLLRLGIFPQIFGLETEQSKKKLLLEEVVGEQYSCNQILSIWYAYINEISKENRALNIHMNALLGRARQKGRFNLQTYTYALVCYVSCFHTLIDPSSGPLYKLIRDEIPFVSKAKLLPYQFSLLLRNINSLKKQRSQLDDQSNAAKDAIVYPKEFIDLLMRQFQVICKRRNVTLRNVANSLKEFNEAFGVQEHFLHTATEKTIAILSEEIAHAEKNTLYNLNYKVDLLSFSSLVWKVSESFQGERSDKRHSDCLKRFVEIVVNYMKVLKGKGLLNRMTSKEILMIYSGFALVKQQTSLNLDEQFTEMTNSLVAQSQRKYTVKEATLILVYLKTIKVVSTPLCDFFRSTLTNLQATPQFSSNPKAKQALDRKCILGAGGRCLNCTNPIAL